MNDLYLAAVNFQLDFALLISLCRKYGCPMPFDLMISFNKDFDKLFDFLQNDSCTPLENCSGSSKDGDRS